MGQHASKEQIEQAGLRLKVLKHMDDEAYARLMSSAGEAATTAAYYLWSSVADEQRAVRARLSALCDGHPSPPPMPDPIPPLPLLPKKNASAAAPLGTVGSVEPGTPAGVLQVQQDQQGSSSSSSEEDAPAGGADSSEIMMPLLVRENGGGSAEPAPAAWPHRRHKGRGSQAVEPKKQLSQKAPRQVEPERQLSLMKCLDLVSSTHASFRSFLCSYTLQHCATPCIHADSTAPRHRSLARRPVLP